MDELEDTVQLNHQMAPKVFRPHEWVLIRREMNTEDDITIQNRMAKMAGVKNGQKSVDLTMTVTDPSGQQRDMPFPYSPNAITKLPRPVSSYVYKKINEYNPDPDEEEQESFLPSVVD